jgi:hypothetical protein
MIAATSSPAWGTIVIAFLSASLGGLIGTVLSTLLRIRHERETELRQRMLVAADDFTTAALQATLHLVRLQDIDDALDDEGMINETTQTQLNEAQRHIDETHARLARVQLLFGEDTWAGSAAGDVLAYHRKAIGALAVSFHTGDRSTYEDALTKAVGWESRFNHFARSALRGESHPRRYTPWWARMEAGEEEKPTMRNPPEQPPAGGSDAPGR